MYPRESYVVYASAPWNLYPHMSHFVTCYSYSSTYAVTCPKRIVMKIKRVIFVESLKLCLTFCKYLLNKF